MSTNASALSVRVEASSPSARGAVEVQLLPLQAAASAHAHVLPYAAQRLASSLSYRCAAAGHGSADALCPSALLRVVLAPSAGASSVAIVVSHAATGRETRLLVDIVGGGGVESDSAVTASFSYFDAAVAATGPAARQQHAAPPVVAEEQVQQEEAAVDAVPVVAASVPAPVAAASAAAAAAPAAAPPAATAKGATKAAGGSSIIPYWLSVPLGLIAVFLVAQFVLF